MDLQAPQVPGIEIVFTQEREVNQSPETSSKRKRVPSIVDEILSISTSPKKLIEQLERSKSSSSEDDSQTSLRNVEMSSNVFQQFETALDIFEADIEHRGKIKYDLESLSIKNTQDHLEIWQHIQKHGEDLGSFKTRIEYVEQLQKILNEGLTAARESEALRNQKVTEKQNGSEIAQRQLDATLQQMQTNANLYTEIKQQYNEQAIHIEELKQQYTQLTHTQPLLNRIMSILRLNGAITSENSSNDSPQTDDVTLEDVLTQQQEKLLNLGEMIQQLKNAQKKEDDYQKIIDDFSKKITVVETAVKNDNRSTMRRAFFLTTGSMLALLASFLIYWQTHKA